MTVTLDKEQSRKRVAEIRALWNKWDPIGVADKISDEYDSYLAPTMRLLERNAPIDEIVGYLDWVTHEHMGLPGIPNASSRDFAARLQRWFSANWSGTRVPGT